MTDMDRAVRLIEREVGQYFPFTVTAEWNAEADPFSKVTVFLGGIVLAFITGRVVREDMIHKPDAGTALVTALALRKAGNRLDPEYGRAKLTLRGKDLCRRLAERSSLFQIHCQVEDGP